MNLIEQKFKSGNSVEVERITLTREEWEQFKKEHFIFPSLPVDEEFDKTMDRVMKKHYDEFSSRPLTRKVGEQPCMWDQLSEEERKKPQLLSCPCPKCTIQY